MSHYSGGYTSPGLGGMGNQGGRGQANGTNNNLNNAAAGPGGLAHPGGLGQPRPYPDLGMQMDMNVLWEYIQNLSQMHEGIRSQTQQVLQGVQEVQRQREVRPSVDNNVQPEANGVASPPSNHADTVSNLQQELSTAQSNVSSLASQNAQLSQLLVDYESAVTFTLSKLRPFAQSHTSAANAQKGHYLNLLEEERKTNLDLRLEQQGWQEKLGSVVSMLREALKTQAEGEKPWRDRVKGLKEENRSLRRLAGLEVEDSSDEEGPVEGHSVMEQSMSQM